MADASLYVFVDNSNVLIEGRRFAEAKKSRNGKLSPYKDAGYEIDWGKFLYLLKEKDTRAFIDVPVLYGSRPPAEDSVWNRIRDDGFDVKLFDRNIRNKEKGVDMEMGMDVAQLLYTVPSANDHHRSWRRRLRAGDRPSQRQGLAGRGVVLEQCRGGTAEGREPLRLARSAPRFPSAGWRRRHLIRLCNFGRGPAIGSTRWHGPG